MAKKTSLNFHNKLSASFKEIHVDGAFGGITPRGFINLNFFAERFPIPKSSTYSLNEDKKLGEKISDSDDSKDGIIREYEFGIYMDIKTAKDISNFLHERITELELEIKNNGTDPR